MAVRSPNVLLMGLMVPLEFYQPSVSRHGILNDLYGPEVLAPVLSNPGRVRWKPTHRDVVDTCPILPAHVDRCLRILPESSGDIAGARQDQPSESIQRAESSTLRLQLRYREWPR